MTADPRTAAKPPRPKPPPLGEATHYELAERWALSRSAGGAHFPRFVGGTFFVPGRDGVWQPLSVGKVEAEVAAIFQGEKLCRKAADYRGITATAINLCDEPQFFADAPLGVATPAGFHRIGADHAVVTEPLGLEHRQVFRLAWSPDADVEPVRFDGLLASALAGDDEAQQTRLLWELIGACLFGLLARHQVAGLMIGAARSGKSTIQEILRRMFPADAVSAVSPAAWGREYFVASLAGRRLNLVGELDDAAPIPAAAFKNVTGGGLIEGRHPTHRPFSFVCTAAHVFATNVLPATTDRSEAFYRRWRIVQFRHRVPDDQVDIDLADKIVRDEMPGILWQAFRAAERVSAAGRLSVSPSHLAMLDKWRHAANPLMQWMTDADAVELDPQAREIGTPEAYDAYRRWAGGAGFRHVLSRNHFVDLLETTGPAFGVVVTRPKGSTRRLVRGLRPVDPV